jgi:LytS/YehU family sensor histidine kinase
VLLSIIIISAFVCYYFFSNIFGVKNNFLQWTVDIIFVLIITTAIKFVRNGFQQKLQLHELKTKQLEAELNFLKSQINPHFLFNMLNNLYALSLDNSKKVPEVILKLSDLMRYMLKASSDKQVQLQDECTFLKNYLELEKLRLHNNCHVTSNFSGDLTGKIITPMLLIPFAENSFKHGSKNKAGAFYIHIELIVTNNRLLFRVENSKDEKTKNHEQKPISHVGLSNIKKRLELSYPDKHKLSINDNKYTYSVELELQL